MTEYELVIIIKNYTILHQKVQPFKSKYGKEFVNIFQKPMDVLKNEKNDFILMYEEKCQAACHSFLHSVYFIKIWTKIQCTKASCALPDCAWSNSNPLTYFPVFGANFLQCTLYDWIVDFDVCALSFYDWFLASYTISGTWLVRLLQPYQCNILQTGKMNVLIRPDWRQILKLNMLAKTGLKTASCRHWTHAHFTTI